MDINLHLPNKAAEMNWRTGKQPLMPTRYDHRKTEGYNIYPVHHIGNGKIDHGYPSLAKWIAGQRFVAIDGYVGVFWENVRYCLTEQFDLLGKTVMWVETAESLLPAHEIQHKVAPYIGQPNGVWGTKAHLKLADLYDIRPQAADAEHDITIIIGTGAALMAEAAPLIYFDLPKNELQLRMRAGSITNLGALSTGSNSEMYKRFYFVDWVLLNEHKKNIVNRIAVIADGQWKEEVTWMLGEHFTAALNKLAQTVFRVRPWFEPGAWGGQWMKERIAGLDPDEVNYAWSFELIVPENGVVFESDGTLLEVSFDFLMFRERDAVLGKFAERFGNEFPIRFDFLDTWQGGNLSIQCHPTLSYIREHFGETITQDETYYILDCEQNANVYLGFQENIHPEAFRKVLEDSRDNGVEVDITKYVQSHKANKHDLFLIPNGTVHSAGAGNLVLEISATPYIFTFKMYDWLRLDLNGEPRAINIDHAFKNLNFDRKGEKVKEELISKQSVIAIGSDWQIVHVPTHPEHFYDVHRLEFESSVVVETNGSCHVLMLVEGESVTVKVGEEETTFAYAETFVIPAAAQYYNLINNGKERARVVKAFLKS